MSFYKNSSNQTIAFISSKVVYYILSSISSMALLKSEVSTAIKCSVLMLDN